MTDTNTNDSADRLALHIEAIENIEAEIKASQDDRKDRYAVAKSEGYDTKALKAVVRRRAMERAAREEFDAIVETYETTLGAR